MTSPSKPFDLAPMVPKFFLGATVALVVARPLIGDSDPARQTITCGAGPLTHQLLTFLLLFLWGCWRVKARLPVTCGGGIVCLLLAVLGLMIASTLVSSHYQHASWSLVWEMASLVAMVWIVRQWSDTPGANLALLSVLIALAASVSAQAIYQRLSGPMEWPNLEMPRMTFDKGLVGDFAHSIPVAQLPEATGVPRGCFDSSETLFAFLLAMMPLVLLVGHVGWWHQKTARSRGRLLIVLLVGGAFLIAAWSVFAEPRGPTDLKSYHEGSSLGELIGQGPGMVSRYFYGLISTTRSGARDLQIALGAVTLLLIFLASLLVLRPLFSSGKFGDSGRIEDAVPLRNILLSGGLAGSVLGFVLSTGNIPAEAPPSVVLNLGVVAGVRSLVFFATLALLQGIVLPLRSLLRVIGVSIVLVVVFSLLSNRLSLTTVLHPFVVLAAIALSLRDGHTSTTPQAVWKPFLVCLGGMVLIVIQLLQSFQPGLTTTTAVRQARDASRLIEDLQRDITRTTGPRQFQAKQDLQRFLSRQILVPLRSACKTDSTNSILLIETARWLRLEWDIDRQLQDEKRASDVTKEMLALHETAVKLDPWNVVALTEQLETLLYIFDESRTLRKERAALIDRNLTQIQEQFRSDEFVAREKYLQILLRIYERPVAKPVEEERAFIREALEAEAVKVFELDAQEREGGRGFRPQAREDWIRKLQIAILDPKPELRVYLEQKKN